MCWVFINKAGSKTEILISSSLLASSIKRLVFISLNLEFRLHCGKDKHIGGHMSAQTYLYIFSFDTSHQAGSKFLIK